MRRSERMAVDEKARLRPNDWSSLEVRLVDLSESGFRARCDAMLMVGSAVRVDLPGIGEVEAQLSWRRGGEIGAMFVTPIDTDRCTVKPVGNEATLARLLIQRAGARSAGRFGQEQQLRAQILSALPVRRLDP